jgi:hypothetical protein
MLGCLLTSQTYSYLSIHGARKTSNVDVLEAAINTSYELQNENLKQAEVFQRLWITQHQERG